MGQAERDRDGGLLVYRERMEGNRRLRRWIRFMTECDGALIEYWTGLVSEI